MAGAELRRRLQGQGRVHDERPVLLAPEKISGGEATYESVEQNDNPRQNTIPDDVLGQEPQPHAKFDRSREQLEKMIQKYVSSWHSTVRSEAHVPLQTVRSNYADEAMIDWNQRVPSRKGIKCLKPSKKSFFLQDHKQLEPAIRRAQDLLHKVAGRITERDSSQFSSIA